MADPTKLYPYLYNPYSALLDGNMLPAFQAPIVGEEGTNKYRWLAQQPTNPVKPNAYTPPPKSDEPQKPTDWSSYIGAATAGVGLVSDMYNTANSYTENTFRAKPVGVPTSQEGLGWLSAQRMTPRRTAEDFGYQEMFKCGGKMGRKYGHGGYWPDMLGAGMTGASAGAMFSPAGAVVGGVLGLTTSLIGNEFRNAGAREQAALYNEQARQQEANRAYALGLGASQIGQDRVGTFMRDYVYADGGALRSVMDGGNGVTEIKSGGKHESNSLGGVPMGIASDGLPNLVEEGEVKWDKENYVFSNRLKPTKKILKENVLENSKWEGKTYAEIAKAIQTASEERENDPMARQTVDEMLGRLMSAQEETRMEKMMKEMQKMIAQMSPQELADLAQSVAPQQPMMAPQQPMQMPPQGVQMAPQQPMGIDPAMMGAEAPQEAEMMQEQPMMAYGGHIFAKGGKTDNPPKDKINFASGSWGAESGSDWMGSVDPGWVEAEAAMRAAGIDPKKADRKTVAKYLRQSKAYQTGTEWLKASEDNMLKYLTQLASSNDAPQKAKNWANKFVKDGKWKEGVNHGYNDIFNKREDEYPGTYWKTPQWILDEVAAANAPAETPVAEPAKVAEDPKTGIRYYIKDGNNYTYLGTPDFYNQWVLTNANYSTPQQFRTPEEDGVKYTDYYVQAPPADNTPKVPFPHYSPWLGALNAGVGLLGGFNVPDYEKANILDSFTPQPVDYTPLGHYLAYDPMDANYMANMLRSQNAGTRAMINNQLSPSRGANLLAADYNGTIGLGTAYEQARQYNDKNRTDVANFNRATDQVNVASANQAANTNFGLNQFGWDQAKAYADARDQATTLASTANSAAVSGALNSLNEGYKDWYNANALGWLIDQGIYHGVSLDDLAGIWGTKKNG